PFMNWQSAAPTPKRKGLRRPGRGSPKPGLRRKSKGGEAAAFPHAGPSKAQAHSCPAADKRNEKAVGLVRMAMMRLTLSFPGQVVAGAPTTTSSSEREDWHMHRLAHDMVRRGERGERRVDRARGTFVGDERDQDAAARLVAALDEAFDRHAGVAHRSRDFG